MLPEKKVWLVTGASSGFGRALSEHALGKGDKVVATLRKPEMLADLVEKYSADRLLVLKLDVTKREEIVSAFVKAHETFGRVDVVLNNAGYAVNGEVEAVPEDMAKGIFDVNFWGMLNVSTEAIRVFRDVNKPSGGRLLQMSSASGMKAIPCVGFYAATKYAIEGLTDSLAGELHPDWNIKITILEPGVFNTKALKENIVAATPHPAYGEGTFPHMMRQAFETGVFEYVYSNLDVFCDRVYKAVSTPDLPLRLPLGKTSMEAYEQKIDELTKTVKYAAAWQEGIDLS